MTFSSISRLCCDKTCKINLGSLNSAEHSEQATTVTAFEIDQGHFIKDQSITVLVLFSESIGI